MVDPYPLSISMHASDRSAAMLATDINWMNLDAASGTSAMALIKCSECQQTISDKAESCPHCGAPRRTAVGVQQQPDTKGNGFLNSLLRLVVTIACLGLLGLIVINLNGPDKNAVSPTSAVSSIKPAEVISFTANDLFDAYDRNEVATDIALKGKIVQVSGRVQSINKDAFNSIYVSLVTSNQFMSAQMHVDKLEEAKMAALQKGQSVVFRCSKMQRWAGSPSGSDCVLVSGQ